MKIEIRNRWSNNVQVTVEIDDRFANEPRSTQIGEAIRVALKIGSDLRGSDLRGSDLRGSDLRGSNLSDSNLSGSDLRGSDLRGSDLRDSDLSDSDLRGSNLSEILSLVKVPSLNRKILHSLDHGGSFEMGGWHGEGGVCGTTHCRAGWSIHLAGPAGAMLEATWGSAVAGALIHLASCPEMERVPDFYASNEEALADIRREAEKEPELV